MAMEGEESELGAARRARRLAIELDRASAALNADRVRELLAEGAGFCAEGNNGESTLRRVIHGAHLHWGEAAERCETIVELLLRAGADPNERGPAGRTLLHTAAFVSANGVIESLLSHGADASAADACGSAPAHCLTASRGLLDDGGGAHVGLVRSLAEAEADFQAKNKAGETPIELSRQRGHWALAEAMEAWEQSKEIRAELPRAASGRAPAL